MMVPTNRPLWSLGLCLAVVGALGCDPDQDPVGGTEAIDAYAMLEEGASWTYRCGAADTGEPDCSALLLARHAGDGLVELRRGSRWADAVEVGHLQWRLSETLVLDSWELDGDSGAASVTVLSTEHGESIDEGGWSCEISQPEFVETYYAIFERPLVSTCTGGGGPEGSYAFAMGFGLIQLTGGEHELDLVAPW
jgi:hypothetical protein